MKHHIYIKTDNSEMDFALMCEKEYLKINHIMHLIEKEMNISLHDYPELRSHILDVSNFVKRLPSMISEVVEIED